MSIQRFKVSLNAARFPLVSTKGQRAVFSPGLDNAPRTPRAFVGDEESVDYNLAQILYGENIMPVSEGIKSVGYRQVVSPTTYRDFDQIFALRDDAEHTVLYSPAAGKNYVYDAAAGLWKSSTFWDIHGVYIDPASPNTEATAKVTYAYIEGMTFVCYSRLLATGGTDASILVWDPATTSLEPAGALLANLPFDAGTIDGISSSNGFLIVYSEITVAWANFNGTAFDFTIYANGEFTGSGFQVPEDLQGNIKACIPLPGGFVIFTTKNAVSATYHARDLVAPWVFREVAGCGGLESYEQATVEGSLGSIIAYTTTGLQNITLNSSKEAYPDISDFITGRQIERYDFATNELRQGSTSLDFYTKLTNIANRYFVVSYGTLPTVYSFALVYDMTLQRWGKLRIVHRDCFYYSYGTETAALTYSMLGDVPYEDEDLTSYAATSGRSNAIVAAQHGLAFLRMDGAISIAGWSNQARDEDAAVAVIGRVQLARARHTQFNRAEVEGLTSGTVYLQPSHNGKDLGAAEQLVEIESTESYKIVGGLIDCKNFNLVIRGSFNLSTIILEAATSGRV